MGMAAVMAGHGRRRTRRRFPLRWPAAWTPARRVVPAHGTPAIGGPWLMMRPLRPGEAGTLRPAPASAAREEGS